MKFQTTFLAAALLALGTPAALGHTTLGTTTASTSDSHSIAYAPGTYASSDAGQRVAVSGAPAASGVAAAPVTAISTSDSSTSSATVVAPATDGAAPATTGAVDLDGATSFMFLWSAPYRDSSITIDGKTWTGEEILQGRPGPVWATFQSDSGMHHVSFHGSDGADVKISALSELFGGQPVDLPKVELPKVDFPKIDVPTLPTQPTLPELPRHPELPAVPSGLPVITAVPEPQAYLLLLAGLAVGTYLARRSRKR